ncbi:MAG: ABC transporter permease [Vicinamibacterales bacterium]
MNLSDLKLRLRALIARRRVERELDDELAFHIECETRKHIAAGVDPAEARARARARFGSPALVADECRDARGTAFVDSSARDVLYAFRALRRAPLAALTIIVTLGLGLGLVAVVFTFYNAIFLRADAVRNPAELFEARRAVSPGVTRVWVTLTRHDYDALRSDTDVFTHAAAMLPGIEARIEGRALDGTLVTRNFFQMVGAGAALGRPLQAADDERHAGRPVVVLSHRGWTKLFGNDSAVIGRPLVLNGVRTEIIGVMPPGFRGLAVSPPDFWAPLDLLDQFRQAMAGKEDAVAIEVVGRLKPGVSSEAATARLTAWASANPAMQEVNGRPKSMFLKPRQGTASVDLLDGLRRLAPLFFAFGLILLIGCANVANLLLARGIARQREIGVRLSLGASRMRIIRQLLTESLLLALAAAVCGFVILRLALNAGTYAAVNTLAPALAEQVSVAASAADWRVGVFLLCGAIVSTAFFGLVPALQATRPELVRTMRGEVTRDARPSRARNALIAVQVGASAALCICAAVFLRSALAAASVEPGLRTSDTVLVEIANESTRAAMLQAVNTDPAVAAVAASWPHGVGGENAVAKGWATLPVEHKFVSPEYFGLLDIHVVQGRVFTPQERSPGAGVAVVSQREARRLWPDRNAVGQVMELEAFERRGPARPGDEASTPQLPFRAFTVVGVVRDAWIGLGMFERIDAGVYLPISAQSPGTSLTLRVHGDPDQASRGLMERLAKVDPAIGGIGTMRAIAGRAAFILQTVFWLTAVLGILALVLTVSGLFSVLSYVVAQRSKEIGVRMALGARPRDIARLVLSQSARPVGAGLAVGALLAGSVATVLMATRAASGIAEIVHTFDAVAYAASLFCIVAACALAAWVPAMRAARIDPVATLRQD